MDSGCNLENNATSVSNSVGNTGAKLQVLGRIFGNKAYLGCLLIWF